MSDAVTREEFDKLLDNLESIYTREPSTYSFSCWGGSSSPMVQMVRATTSSNHYSCKLQGDKNWITPDCELCTGLTQEKKTLSSEDVAVNRTVKQLLAPIRHNFKLVA